MTIARLISLCAALALCTTLASTAGAQTTNPFKKPPAAATTAPVTATEKAKAAAPAKPEAPAVDAVEAKKPPSEAQLASRNRMKECGADWQDMKTAGKTKGKTWREFSSECLKKKKM